MLKISPTTESEITKIVCPKCREKLARVGIEKGSRIEGLTFRCRRCGNLWSVKTE